MDSSIKIHGQKYQTNEETQNTIVSEGFKEGTRGASIMPRDAVSRTADVERNGGHKWINVHNDVRPKKFWQSCRIIITNGIILAFIQNYRLF